MLGAFEVAENGDLANWAQSATRSAPAVGGAMDLAAGAKRVWVVMEHTTKDGTARMVQQCSYPLTAQRCVSASTPTSPWWTVTPNGFVVTDMIAGPVLRRAAGADRRPAAS